MKVLVTGSSGHLGEALMRRLPALGHAPVGMDLAPSPFTSHVGSIADRDAVARACDGIEAVIHAATLHKPHVATHSRAAFVETNVSGTLNLLEEAVRAGARTFVFTSTTSAFGGALSPAQGEPAAWIDEDVRPVPRNIYGVTKTAAEDLCALFHRLHELSCVVLRTARFFPEPDDDHAVRARYPDGNMRVNELLFRRLDIEDAVSAHALALEKAEGLGFARFILSATTPFAHGDLAALRADAPAVVERLFPRFRELYAARGWAMPPSLDRVYDNARARDALGWRPRWDFAAALEALVQGRPPESGLAREVGVKGYHGSDHVDGVYPVA